MAGPLIYSPNSSVIQQKANLFIGATNFLASGTATLTRGAKGEWYWAVGASQTVYLAADLKTILRNYNSTVVNYAYKGVPASPFSLVSATANYLISTADMTTLTLGVSETSYPASGVATTPSVSDLLAPAALTVTHTTDLYQVTVTPANNALLPNSVDQLMLEIEAVTPASSVFHLYGVALVFNYNI